MYVAKTKRKKCSVCQIYFAKYFLIYFNLNKLRIICFNDQISDKSFLFFCENCYNNIHYE